MATLKAVVRKQKACGPYPVYIRVTVKNSVGYINTHKVVNERQISPNGEIKDAVISEYCSRLILRYTDKLNRKNLSALTKEEIISYLKSDAEDEIFSDYARLHIKRMEERGQKRNAKNYKLALAHLERYLGNNQITFAQLSSTVLKKWIETLSKTTNRAKEMYPVCIRQIFRAALVDLNDEERGLIKIKYNPWLKVQIPKSDKTTQRAISAEACREFFNRPLPSTKMISSLPELGRDVAQLVLCLGGINTVDLFYMKKENYRNGVIGYNRAKTRRYRADSAYIEMRVEPFIQPIFDKYLAPDDDEYLFNFHLRYCDSDSFSANVNSGIRKICKDMGMSQEDYYCVYTFRHTWGTIAQNDCDANLHDVAFGMNHSHGFKVTRGYVKMDFSPAWRLNAKVIDFIFFNDAPSKQGKAKDLEEPKSGVFRISKKMMVYGRAYFKGRVLAEVTDLGFNNIEEVIETLARQLPATIPQGCAVQFRITNCDSQKEVVYQRTKGMGF